MEAMPLLVLAIVSLLSKAAAPQDARAQVPTADAIANVRRLVNAMYQEELRGPSRTKQIELERKLLDHSRQPDIDVATKYVLLEMARDTAIAVDDDGTALAAIEELSRSFQIDAAGAKIEFVDARAAATNDPDRLARFVASLLRDVPTAFVAEDLATADRLIAEAQAVLKRSADPDATALVTRARDRSAQLDANRDAFASARATLATNPSDARANGVVGFHLCLLLEQWERGLPVLVLGDSPELSAAAALELKPAPDAETRLKIADRWYEVASRLPPIPQTAARLHAATWYRRVFHEVKGTERRRVAKRLAEIDPPPALPKSTLKIDPADWRLYRRITGDWQPHLVDGTVCTSKGTVFTVKNPGDTGGQAKLIFVSRLFDGDFVLWIKYRGPLHTISIGEPVVLKDRIIYLDRLSTDRTDWKSLVMRRTRDGLTVWIDGEPDSVVLHNTDEFLASFFSVELSNGQEISLRDFAFRGGLLR